MADPVSQFARRIAYGARQLPRVAWYIGHGMVMRRLSQAARERAGATTRPRAHTRASVPDRRRLYADMAVLFRQDLANIEAGIYPLPADHDGTLPAVLGRWCQAHRMGVVPKNGACRFPVLYRRSTTGRRVVVVGGATAAMARLDMAAVPV